ncbi:hypothetical protein [Jiulongibacter sediminis]|uniref:LVIVD repeat-containing protein n=1 Tax=Jiulongibacter sediminis TaxID=1605367 RepID=A0A0P7C3M5_9BACT|nr:hypothetical protein [Jiulongibacter sediminis]KPM49247.1 hypothetical protein AFM12_01045 [Jiulongibacter sediminis]TBX26302.1 hypothetical protein TK44_01045 [Jiulongibacter sediminis]
MKKLALLFVAISAWSCTGDVGFANSDSGFESGAPGNTGRGGSLARFTIIDDFLYTVNGNDLKFFQLNGAETLPKGSITLNAFAETIFPFRNHLLIGTRTGMHIYGLENPENPNYVSQYQHFASCDPVVAQGNHAYVTLRNGTPCMWGQNQLDILDISSFSNPIHRNSVQMQNPQGLAADGDKLYVCEGQNGMAIFDITDPEFPQLEDYKTDVKPFDVIAFGNKLILTGENGISQYATNETDQLQLLSTIQLGE